MIIKTTIYPTSIYSRFNTVYHTHEPNKKLFQRINDGKHNYQHDTDLVRIYASRNLQQNHFLHVKCARGIGAPQPRYHWWSNVDVPWILQNIRSGREDHIHVHPTEKSHFTQRLGQGQDETTRDANLCSKQYKTRLHTGDRRSLREKEKSH